MLNEKKGGNLSANCHFKTYNGLIKYISVYKFVIHIPCQQSEEAKNFEAAANNRVYRFGCPQQLWKIAKSGWLVETIGNQNARKMEIETLPCNGGWLPAVSLSPFSVVKVYKNCCLGESLPPK
jgi:hypothetical protein